MPKRFSTGITSWRAVWQSGSRPPIRPEAWAYDLGIEIIEADLDGASAQLIRLGDLVQIVLSKRITESGARRFAIAHELYHFLKRHETTYEAEWVRIFHSKQLMDDMQQRSKLLAFAAIDVLEVQHEHSLIVCRTDGVVYDSNPAEEIPELLAAMRTKIEKGLP